jgi:hypothetical protein
MSVMKLVSASLLVIVGLLGGCSEQVHVNVHCVTTAAPAVECDVAQVKGKGEVEVCWDFTATCENGAVVKTHGCQKVKDGGTEKTTIPADKLVGLDQCQGSKPPVAKVENITLNGKASTNPSAK